jgi:hypothetical protein
MRFMTITICRVRAAHHAGGEAGRPLAYPAEDRREDGEARAEDEGAVE